MNRNQITPFTTAPLPRRSPRIAAAAASASSTSAPPPPVNNLGTNSSSNRVPGTIARTATRQQKVGLPKIPAATSADTSTREKTSQDVVVSQALATVEIGNRRNDLLKGPSTASSKVSSLSRRQQEHDSNNNVGSEEGSASTNCSSIKKKSEVRMTTTTSGAATSENLADAGGDILKNFEVDKCQFCCVNLRAFEGVMLEQCLHIYCRDCLQAAIEMQPEAIKIPCPINCGSYLTDGEVKALVRPEVYQEYLDRSLVIAKKKMKNVFNCKTNGCSGWCEFENGRKTFICPQCKESNCLDCNAIHTGVDCSTFKDLAQKGQLHKVKELMKKEEKNGWAQLMAIVNASGKSQINIMADNDLLQNSMEFECPICYTDIPPGDGIILHECLHLFCKDCLKNLVEHNDETNVKCPYIDENYSCVNFMQPREIKALVPKATFDKHLQRSLKLGESSIENSFHCKTADCIGWTVIEEDSPRVFICPICNAHNCTKCMAIHTGSCEDYKNRLTQNENDKLSADAVEKLIQKGEYMRCPKCKIPVQKTVGCDWIQCSACRTEICWVTRGPRWGPKGHGDITGGCRCKVNGKKCHPKCGNCH